MKKLLLVTFASLFAAIGCAHAEAPAADAAAPKTGPFYNMYPSQLAPAAEAYFGEWNKALFKEGPIETKAARLAAIAASAAMKCEYCITAQAMLGKPLARPMMRLKARLKSRQKFHVSRFCSTETSLVKIT